MPFLRAACVMVGTTAVALASNGSAGGSNDYTPVALLTIANQGGAGSGVIYLGDANVKAGATSSNAFALASNATPITLNTLGQQVYAVSSENSQCVRIIEVA